MPITHVPALVENFKYYSYATYFFFADEVLTYMSAQSADSAPNIAGYAGKVWAPFLAIDLDHAELTRALDAARRLCSLFLERWQIDANALQIYFSGAKGFHLLLDTRLFGRVAPNLSNGMSKTGSRSRRMNRAAWLTQPINIVSPIDAAVGIRFDADSVRCLTSPPVDAYVWEHSRAHYKHPVPTDQEWKQGANPMTLGVRVPVAPTIVLGKQQMNNQSQQGQQGQIEKFGFVHHKSLRHCPVGVAQSFSKTYKGKSCA